MTNTAYVIKRYYNGSRLVYRDGVLVAYVG